MKRTIFLLVSLLLCATMSAATPKDSTKTELILHVGMRVTYAVMDVRKPGKYVIPSYALLHLTWRLNKEPKKK